MNTTLTFRDFLNQTDYRLSGKGKIFRNDFDDTRLTNNSITITQIDLDSCRGKLIDFDVSYKVSDTGNTDSIIVTRMSNGQIDSTEWEKLLSNIDFRTADKKIIQNLYKQYFKKALTLYFKDNPAASRFTGWFNDENGVAYLPLDPPFNNPNVEKIKHIFFNGLLDSRHFSESIEECRKQTEGFQDFFSFICSNPSLITMFAYALHSFFFDYYSHYRPFKLDAVINPDTALFSLCLHGDNIPEIKTFANILLNFFQIDRNKWQLIKRNIHVSATSLSSRSFDMLYTYASVPIIITSKTNRLTKGSSIIKKLHHLRESGKNFIFPVYINTAPILADEIVNCDLNSVKLSVSNDIGYFHKLHMQCCCLLYFFIQFLQSLEPYDVHNKIDYDYVHLKIYNAIDEHHISSEWLDEHLPQYLLYYAIDCFCYFLKQNDMNDIAEKLCSSAAHIFLPCKDIVCSEMMVHSTLSDQTDTILKLFALFLSKKSKTNSNNEWLFTGTEKRGNKEECYYLRQKDGFKKFQEYLIQEKVTPISQRIFDKSLRDHELLKLPASGKSNTLCRGNKEYFYVLYKDKIDLLPNENFQK